jgi:transposase
MPYRKISRDLKLAAMRMHEHGILSVAQITDCLQISRRTFYRVLELWHTTGDVVQHTNGVRGRPRILHFDDIDYLNRIIKHRPDWFLDELLSLLETNRFISAHFSTIHQELVRAGVSTKKLKKIAAERNENLRADYIRHIAQYSPEQLGFLDELSKDERTLGRSRGRSRKGTRAVKKGVFVRGRRFSATGLLTIDGMISNTVVEGSMTRDLFLEYLEFTVVCYCLGLWVCIYSCSTVSRSHYAHHSLDISASW